jgi:xylan 1,4-beta-xylosidase
VDVALAGLPANVTAAKLTEWRIDETHSNAFTVWKTLGSPAKLNAEQRRDLENASRLAVMRSGENTPIAGGSATVKLTLPRQGMSLVELSW